jgi:hypothetical protein
MQTQQRRQTSVVLFSIALLIGSLFVAPAANAAVTPAGITIDCTNNTRTQTFTGAVGDTFTIENISGGAACTTDLTSGVVTGPVSIADRVSATFTIVKAGTFTVLASGGIETAIMTVAISDSVVVPPDVTMTFAGCEASPISKTGMAGASYDLPSAIECTRKDYTLLGWAHTTLSTKLADPNTGAGATVNYVESGTMNAVWKLNDDKVQVTYDANVATKDECFSGNINVEAAGRTKTVVVPSESFTFEGSAPCTPPGLRLVGWNTLGDGTGTSYAFFGSVPQGPAGGEKITLFAQWGNLCPTVGPPVPGGVGLGPVSPVPSLNVQWQGCDLTGANLSSAYLAGANLSSANLAGAWLNSSNLIGANLTGANLIGAKLYGADLTGANLTGANLTGADIWYAILNGANLSGANLSGAKLADAELNGANLSGANLSNANLERAGLGNANLSNANLTSADLERARLAFANLTGAELTGANLTGVFLNGIVSGEVRGFPSALPADWTLVQGTLTIPCAKAMGFVNSCKIGDTGPGGGVVFYVDETNPVGSKYKEIAPPLAFKERWAPSSFLNFVGCAVQDLPIDDSTGPDTGAKNTSVITKACRELQAPAAWAAKNYKSNGKNDWFLPSLQDLFDANGVFFAAYGKKRLWSSNWTGNLAETFGTFDSVSDPTGLIFTIFKAATSDLYWVSPVRAF